MSRFTQALAAAVILHGILTLAVLAVRPPVRPSLPVSELEIAIDPSPVAPEPIALPPAAPDVEPTSPALPTAHVARVSPASPASGAPPAVSEVVAVPAASGTPDAIPPGAPGAEPGWSISPLASSSGVNLALQGTAKYGPPGAAGSAQPEGAPVVQGGFDDLATDISHGITRNGAARTAAVDATRASIAPVDGWAVFDVFADETGHVTRITVIDVSEDRPSWEDVAKDMLVSLHDKVARVRARTRGLVTRIRVRSKWQRPNGGSARGGPSIGEVLTNPLNVAMQAVDPSESRQGMRAVIATIVSEEIIPL